MKIKDFFRRWSYKRFEKSLDRAEEWRNERIKKDAEKYGGSISQEYDDRLQRHYLNFQTQEFQFKLTVITMIGMLVSGFLSGYLVYNLTQDKEPFLVVSPFETDSSNKTISIQIQNTENNPARMITVFYRIEEIDYWIVNKPIEIPYLDKGREYVNINFKELDNQIIQLCEQTLLKVNALENDFVKIDKGFNVLLKIDCENCKENILQTSSIIYRQGINCSYDLNGKFIYTFDSTWRSGYR